MSKPYRVCSTDGCKVRLPDLTFDGHSRCSTCIGKLCSSLDHCIECAEWSNEIFDKYVKHRHMLELTRLRKAKQRAKAKQLTLSNVGKQLTLSDVGQQAVAGSSHSVSPSPPASVVTLSPSSSLSPYSPSACTKSLPSSSPSAGISAPRDQVITRSEFDSLKSLMMSMATDVATMMKDRQVHSESAPPPSRSVPLTPVVDSGCDPAAHRSNPLPVDGSPVLSGEPCPTGSCPVVQSETYDELDRSRKRVRESKDSSERRKRQRPPSREREATPTFSHGELRHLSTPTTVSARVTPVDLATAVIASVPQGSRPSPKADGTFSDSMVASLEALVASYMKGNPTLTVPQAVVVAKDYLKKNDPLNESYTSARSGQGASVHGRTASARVDVQETPTASDLASKRGGDCVQEGVSMLEGRLDARSHSRDHGQASTERTAVFENVSHGFEFPTAIAQCSTSTPIKQRSDVFGQALPGVSAAIRASEFVTPKDKQSVLASQARSIVDSRRSDISLKSTHTPVRDSYSVVRRNVSAERIFHKEVASPKVSLSKTICKPSAVFPIPVSSMSTASPTRISSTKVVSPAVRPTSESLPLKEKLTRSTQTPTLAKPSLSLQIGPSMTIRPEKSRPRPNLSWTPIDVFEFPPSIRSDQGTSAKPIAFDKGTDCYVHKVNQGTDCHSVMVNKGTSPSTSIVFSPEPPASAATQGNSVSSPPGQPTPSVEVATQGNSSSSLSVSASVSRVEEGPDEESDDESEAESIVLADPTDPDTELLSASESYALLKSKIVSKYPDAKTGGKIIERSSFQTAFEKEKPQASSFQMTPSVKLRLAAVDEELATKKATSSSVTVFSPFLKKRDFRYYATDLSPDFEAQASVLASMAGVLDQTRVKRLKKTKVSFKITELDSIFKSAFRALEIWSYASSSFEVLGDCFIDLMKKLPQEYKELAIQYASLLRCVDKAGRHGIGETVNIVTNLLLKKREHVMSLAHASVPLSTKTDVIFSPVSSCKLLPPEVVKAATDQFRQQTETSALVAVAAASKASTSKSIFKSSDYGRYYPSPLQSKFRGGKLRGTGKASRKFFLRNREYFNKRDRFYRGRGQGKSYRGQSNPTTNQ